MSFRTRGPSELARRQRNNSDIVGSSGRFESKQKWGQKSGGFTKKTLPSITVIESDGVFVSPTLLEHEIVCLFFLRKGWEHFCLEVPSPSPSKLRDDFSMQLRCHIPVRSHASSHHV